MHIQVSLCIKFLFEQLEFLDQICPGKIFIAKIKKVNMVIEFRLFNLALAPNFRLNWQLWFFWTDLPKKGFSCLKQKKWTIHIFYIILNIQISLVQNLSSKYELRLRICIFLDQICTKRYFESKTEKVKIVIEFCRFEVVSWYQISALTDNFVFFSSRFVQKGFSWSKTEKVNTAYFLHIQISLVRNFSSTWQFWFFVPSLPKKVFPLENRKSEHHHGILHIWIRYKTST